MGQAVLVLGLVCLQPLPVRAGAPEGGDAPSETQGDSMVRLAESVRRLGLGEGVFVIGSYLTEDQVEEARVDFLPDTYPGTIKFPSGDVVVVADEETQAGMALGRQVPAHLPLLELVAAEDDEALGGVRSQKAADEGATEGSGPAGDEDGLAAEHASPLSAQGDADAERRHPDDPGPHGPV